MLQIMISSSVLILALLGLRWILGGRISMRLRYALWLLVAVRLLIPVTFGHSSLSVENFTASIPVVEEAPVQGDPVTELSPELGQVTVPGAQGSQEAPGPAVQPNQGQTSQSGMSPVGGTASVEGAASFSWKQALTVAWIVGAVLFVGVILANNIRFQHRLKKGSVRISVEGCPIPVYETEEVVSPCLVGFLRPRIYLRPGLSNEMQTHVLAHEYTHYRHGDHVWTMIRTLCLCAYWFHPLVWVAAYLSRQDGELACDEGAISRLGEERRIPYGRTLLQVIVHANYRTNFLNTATTMGANKDQLKERMTMIAKKPKKLILALIVALLVVSLAVGCSFTGGKEEPALEETDSREEMQETTPTEEDNGIHDTTLSTTLISEAESWMPTYGVDAQKMILPEVMEDHFIEIFDTRGDTILYAEQEKIYVSETANAFYYTHKIGLYDTEQSRLLECWEPKTEGWYFCGTLTPSGDVYCAVKQDYTNAYPSCYALNHFGDQQATLLSLDGEIQSIVTMDNRVLFSYISNHGTFGIGSIENDSYSEFLTWETDQNTMPLDGILSVCGNAVSFSCVENGKATLIVADKEGIKNRHPLEYKKERLDSFCLTSQGIAACISVQEGTPEAHRKLFLLSDNDKPIEQPRDSLYGALYQMRFSETMGVAVDYRWDVHILAISGDKVGSEKLHASFLDHYPQQAVRFYASDEFTFYFFYQEKQDLFRVTIAPSA
jgi:beta-lactamase regulating signal transducer with metallopeptidase domain